MANLVDIIINATDNASRQIDGVNRALDRLNNNGGKLAGIMAGVSGSIAGLAPAVAGVGAMASMFASAGIGAGAFGAVAVSAIGGVVDASEEVAKIEEKIKQADSTEERIKAQKELQQVMAGLSDAQKQALGDLKEFKGWWGSFTASLEKPVFNVMGQGLDFIRNTMEALKPAIESTAGVLTDFLSKVNASFQTDQVKSFFDYINQTAGANLQAILTSAGNLFVGFMEILKAFAPLSQSFSQGMVNMTASFRTWAEGLSQSQGFQKFIEYAKANTPPLLSLIGNLFKFVGQLVVALAPLGSVVLQVASAFVKWLTSSGLVQGALNLVRQAGQFLLDNLNAVKVVLASVLAGFLAFKGVMAIVSIVKVATTVFKTLKTVITAVRTAFMIFNATLLANPITWIVLAIVALIAVGVLLYKNWDTVKAYAQQLWDKLKQVWEGIKTAISTAVTNIITAVSNWWNNMKTGFSNMMTSIGQAVSSGVQSVIQFFVSLPSKILGAIIYLTGFLIGAFIGLMIEIGIAVKNGIVAVVTFFSQLPSKVMSFITNLKNLAVNGFKTMMSNAKSAVQSGIQNVVSFFQSLPSKVMSFLNNLKTQAVNGFKTMMSTAKSAVQSGIQGVVSFFQSLPSKIMGFINSLKSSLVSGFKNMMSSAKSAVSSGVQGIVSAIKGFVSTFVSAGKGLLDAFTKGIKSGISKAVGAVKDGMSAIRKFLPFSPAKKGALSDLDKSGESFFPTWYEGALKMVRPMERAVGGALDKVNSSLERNHGQIALEAFGSPRTTVRQVIEVRGTVDVQGEGGKESVRFVAQEIQDNIATFKDLRQAVRKR
jgi:phage-related protein